MTNISNKTLRVIGIIMCVIIIITSITQVVAAADRRELVKSQDTILTHFIINNSNNSLESDSSNIMNHSQDIKINNFQIDETADEIEESVEISKKYNITEEEREMLAAIIFLEAGTESYECQAAICSVIINRWISGYWGNSIAEVLYAPNQFTPAKYISSTTPSSMQYEVVDDIIMNGTTLPEYVMYFRANFYFDWAIDYISIDNVYFSYMSYDLPC